MFALTVNRFEADPDRVTEILDLTPTFVARCGEISEKSGRPYRANLWEFDVHPNRLLGGVEHEAGITALIEHLRSREQHFARLREEVQPEIVTLYGGLYVRPDEQCGLWLDPEQMRVLANCQVAWGLDIFDAE